MKAYNTRLDHTAVVQWIHYGEQRVQLIDSKGFAYHEKLSNVELLKDTGVKLDGKTVYVRDKVRDPSGQIHIVQEVPGGFYPFVKPINVEFHHA